MAAPTGDDQGHPRRLSDPRLMRALAHPVRLALLETLTLRGPLTATQAGALIGETPTTCSFHLRQLARYGFVEEAGGGRGRSRPWRVVQIGFVIDPEVGDVSGRSASRALASLALSRQVARHERSMDASPTFPEPWRDVGGQSETGWWVTREELSGLQAEIDDLIHRYVDRLADPAKRPLGAQLVEFVVLTHLFDPAVEADSPAGSPAGAAAGSATPGPVSPDAGPEPGPESRPTSTGERE